MATKPKAILSTHDGREASPITKASNVLFENGQTAQDILNDRQDAMISPVIENSSSMFKVGQGDNVDYSSNVVNGAYESMVLKGKSMVNCIQEPSSQDVVLPYEFEDGQYVTINDTKESGALGVELKGQTLVNLLSNKYSYINLPTIAEVELNSAVNTYDAPDVRVKRIKLNQNLQANKKYILLLNVVSLENGKSIGGLTTSTSNEEDYNIPRFSNTGLQYKMFETKFEVKEICLYLDFNETTPSIAKIKQPVLIEYQEGMENWDIPYFEGMASCKLPILHTVGRNLFDKNNYIEIGGSRFYSHTVGEENVATEIGDLNHRWVMLKLPIGKTYSVELDKRNTYPSGWSNAVVESDVNTIRTGGTYRTIAYATNSTTNVARHTFTTTKPYVFIHVGYGSEYIQYKQELLDSIILNVGSSVPAYEPYKSSILSLPEEVVLRSLPNGTCDTLNLNTGVYTQRIGEKLYDGSQDEGWYLYAHNIKDQTLENAICYQIGVADMFIQWGNKKGICCDKLQYDNNSFGDMIESTYWGLATNVISRTNGKLVVCVDKANAETEQDFRNWLSQNPVTVQYQLATPIVRKLTLPSTLKSWNTTTHIYSEIPENTLYPTLSHSNPSYPVILKPSTKYSIVVNSYSNSHTNSAINFNLGGATTSTTVGNRVTTITTPSALSNELLTMSGRGNKLNNVMVIEGDVVGDEPYFEGMCDSKSPILSNTGKNLFDWEAHHWRLNRFQWSHGDGGLGNGNALGRAGVEWVSIKTLKLKPNQTYYTNGYISFYENDGQGLCIDRRIHNGVFTVPTNAEIACVSTLINDGVKLECISDPKIIISEIEMEYEPYKSNILSCNGDKIELTEDMFEQGGVYFTKGQSFADATNNTASDRIRLKTLLNLKPNTTYHVAIDNAHKVGVQLYNNEKLAVSDTGWVSDTTFTTKGGENAVALVIRKLSSTANISMSHFKNIKLQLSEVDKTIVLRSLPDGTCDTLNVETGEYVQRIGEIVLDGREEEWTRDSSSLENSVTNKFYISNYFKNAGFVSGVVDKSNLVCHKLSPVDMNTMQNSATMIYCIANSVAGSLNIRCPKSVDSTNALKTWLRANPINVYCELAAPIVSTIDIQGFPHAYTNGHVILSSGSIEQSLTPKVEYSVATNRNGQIRSNQKMVERHQKQLDRLQAMILANLVNSQYNQTLTTLKYELSRV